jgi:hypothetical protein
MSHAETHHSHTTAHRRTERRRRHRRIAVVTTPSVVLTALILGSCGGGGSGNEPNAGTARSTHTAGGTAGPSTPAPAKQDGAKPAKHTAPPKVATKPVDRVQQHDGRRAVVVLAALPTNGRAPMTGYSRERFGPAWTDDNNDPLGHNGCDTRNDILRRDLSAERLDPATGGCLVESGLLRDPYTSRTIHFRRGETTSPAVQIDHVVALDDAWQTGAQRWSLETRTDLANDPLGLLAVDGPTTEAKSEGDAATWLLPNTAYRCSYVARQIAVKARYRLWVTRAEHDAMARTLAKCPGQKVPQEAKPATLTRTTEHTRHTKQTKGLYADCDEEEAAEALRRGQHGYGPERDGLGDGVACVS